MQDSAAQRTDSPAPTGLPGTSGATHSPSQPTTAAGVLHALQSLCTLARLHEVAADPATLAHQLALHDGQPIGAAELLLAAKHLGLKARSTRTSLERLPLTPLPALARVQCDDGVGGTGTQVDRFVILARCDGKQVLLQGLDTTHPGKPSLMGVAAFAEIWSGELILLTSRATLAGAMAQFDFTWFIPALVKYRKLIGEVLLISFMLQLVALISPLFFQVVMDKVLVHQGISTLNVLVIGLVVVVIFESVLNALRAYVFSHTTSRIDVELGARLFRHLVQLPLAYFQARRVGDSVARVRELENIRSFLTGNAITVLLDVVFSVVFIAVMFWYSVPLTLIVLVSMPLYFGLSLAVVPILRGRLGRQVRPQCGEPGHAGGNHHRYPDRQGQCARTLLCPALGQPVGGLRLGQLQNPGLGQ